MIQAACVYSCSCATPTPHCTLYVHAVNDLGGDMHGGGKSPAADAVVEAIKKTGGTAVANYSKYTGDIYYLSTCAQTSFSHLF